MDTILETKNLTKIFKNAAVETRAVQQLNLSVHSGESVAIIGKSGSGKSTLLHMLGGLEHPSEGEVLFQGTSLYKTKKQERIKLRRRKIGFVFQFFNLIPELSVYENIALPALMDGKKVDEAYIRYLVELLGITEKINQSPSELSGGQQQRVAIARALSNRPAVLLADEPTGNLDEASGNDVISLFQKCRHELHQTMVIVTHDQDIAKQMERIVTLKDGQVLSDRAGEVLS